MCIRDRLHTRREIMTHHTPHPHTPTTTHPIIAHTHTHLPSLDIGGLVVARFEVEPMLCLCIRCDLERGMRSVACGDGA